MSREFSFNLGLSATPETQDPTQFSEIVRLYNAVSILAYYLDLYTGAKAFPAGEWSVTTPAQSLRLQNLTRGYCTFTETVVAGQLLHLQGTARLANATDATRPARAFATAPVTAGQIGEYMLLGAITNFAGLTPGALYYLSTTPGIITSVAPISTQYKQAVGFAVDANTLFFRPDLEIILLP